MCGLRSIESGPVRSILRVALFLVVFVVMVLGFELLLRAFYYQQHARTDEPLAILAAKRTISEKRVRKQATKQIESLLEELGVAGSDMNELPEEFQRKLHRALYSIDGTEVLKEFEKQYEDYFSEFLNCARGIDARVVLLYIPSGDFKGSWENRHRHCVHFFSVLAQKHRVDMIDLTDTLSQYLEEDVTLQPENGHLSRFGNHLVARELADYLSESVHSSSWAADERPRLLGDLEPSKNEIWQIVPSMPYRVITNKQGLRMKGDLQFPKTNQRILVLGDSFTFGPYLENHDCYPNILDTMLRDKTVINAGICGYSIPDELSLFMEKARFSEPDIVILQVLDNDLHDLFYFHRNIYNRQHTQFAPTAAERKLLAKIRHSEK